MPARTSDYIVKNIGENKGRRRLWIEGPQALRAGFQPGEKIRVSVKGMVLAIERHPGGARTVSPDNATEVERNYTVSGRDSRDGSRRTPLIDINNDDVLKVFEGMDAVRMIVAPGRIFFLPLASEMKRVDRLTRLAENVAKMELTLGSAFTGGGTMLHAIKAGLQKAGFKANTAFVSEIREDLADHLVTHNDAVGRAALLNAPLQELVQDDAMMASLPKVDGLEMGIPCSAASPAGMSKKKGDRKARGEDLTDAPQLAEMHEQVGHLVFASLALINRVNPAFLVIENVPTYASTASAWILRHQLRDMGYIAHEAILEGRDFGCIENRVRWCMVAVTRGMEFSWEDLQPKPRVVRTVQEFLDPSIGPDDERWRTFDYLKTKQVRDAAKGNSFAMQTVSPTDTSVPTLRKGYHKGGSTDPLIRHPTDPELLRKFTGDEHAAIKGVPPSILRDLSETEKHEICGQGILYIPFEESGEHIAKKLIAQFGEGRVGRAVEATSNEAAVRKMKVSG